MYSGVLLCISENPIQRQKGFRKLLLYMLKQKNYFVRCTCLPEDHIIYVLTDLIVIGIRESKAARLSRAARIRFLEHMSMGHERPVQ